MDCPHGGECVSWCGITCPIPYEEEEIMLHHVPLNTVAECLMEYWNKEQHGDTTGHLGFGLHNWKQAFWAHLDKDVDAMTDKMNHGVWIVDGNWVNPFIAESTLLSR